MSSIWSSSVAQSGTPFAANSAAPSPGGGAVARFQSLLGSASPSAASPSLAGAGASAAISPADSSSSSSDSGATITANDFLTLLVTEMQNQDPTADTDPNAYIDQLVQINSLEQLISINQNLSEVLGAASSTTTTNAVPSSRGIAHAQAGSQPASQAAGGAGGQTVSSVVHGRPTTSSASATRAPVQGNLSVPPQSAAARATSHALDGHRNPARQGHAIRDIPTRPLP